MLAQTPAGRQICGAVAEQTPIQPCQKLPGLGTGRSSLALSNKYENPRPGRARLSTSCAV